MASAKKRHALVDQDEFLNVLYYGDGGTGKTTHLATLANQGKIVIVNAESGVKRRALERMGVNVENIELWPGPGEDITFRSLEAEWLRIREALQEDPEAYIGWVWDSLSEIYKKLLDTVVAKAFDKSQNGPKPRDSEFFIDRADYGIMTEQVRQLVRKARDLPCHFGASALERREVDDEDAKVTYRPAVTPALQNDLYLWFDVVCYTSLQIDEETGEEQYRGLFRPAGKHRGKDRFKVLPRTLVTPSFDRVLAYEEEELTVASDPIMKEAHARKQAKATKKKGSDGDA